MASVRETHTILINGINRDYITVNVYASLTPQEFFPGQEPLYSDQGSNLRNMYKRAFNRTNTVENTIRKQYIGKTPDSSGRMNRLKSINVGKYAYVRPGEPVTTKSYDPTSVRTALKMVRNN